MRFEIVNVVTNKGSVVSVPPGLNPVRLGNDERNDVKLPSPYVGPEMGAIGNEGDGWKFWNLNGREVKVANHVLHQRHQTAPIAHGEAILCYPFSLRVFFDSDELSTDEDDTRLLDRRSAELVQDLHRQLTELLISTKGERGEQLTDGYIQNLEHHIEDLASRRPDFPATDMLHTSLGNHLAGVAVRSELLGKLVASSDVSADAFKGQKEADGWNRLRTALPDLERDLQSLLPVLVKALGLEKLADLTDQMKQVDANFWPLWRKVLHAKTAPSTRLRRYLGLRRLKEEIKDIWYGFGPLEDLLDDPTITEIMVVDREHIFIEKGNQIENSGRVFLTDPLKIIRDIVNGAGREINTSDPMADARMPDGSRVNGIIPPLALKGPCLTIRRFPRRRLNIDQLIRIGSLTAAARDFLHATVVGRRNILISGGTGTGKTTLLNCLSAFIPDKERIVTVEDTAELQLAKEHVVTLQARQKNSEGKGEVPIRDLVRNALRMRPDRIVVGECRGGEALDMLQAMNTGHDGSLTTIHANSPADVVLRLEVLVQQADSNLPVASTHRMIVSAIDVIVQLSVLLRGGKKLKVVSEISEVIDVEKDGTVRIVPLFAREGPGRELLPTGHLATFVPDLIAAGLVRQPEDLLQGVVVQAPPTVAKAKATA